MFNGPISIEECGYDGLGAATVDIAKDVRGGGFGSIESLLFRLITTSGCAFNIGTSSECCAIEPAAVVQSVVVIVHEPSAVIMISNVVGMITSLVIEAAMNSMNIDR